MNLNFINPTPNQPQPPQPPQPESLDPDKLQEHFDDFYEDLFEELSKYGQIQSLNICDNLADHMVGNVYVQYKEEDHAANALMNLTGRFYSGRPIIVDFSPVTDFREATCRQYEENVCNRGGYCNFMHLKKISRDLRKRLFGRSSRRWNGRSGSRSRSRSPPRSRGYEGGRSYSGRGSGRRDFDRSHGHHGRRPRSRSPGYRGKRSRSPARRDRSPVRERENSEERRARIEQWNREKEIGESGHKDNMNNANNDNYEEPAVKHDTESDNHQI